jgi:hypothetical protein
MQVIESSSSSNRNPQSAGPATFRAVCEGSPQVKEHPRVRHILHGGQAKASLLHMTRMMVICHCVVQAVPVCRFIMHALEQQHWMQYKPTNNAKNTVPELHDLLIKRF